MSLASQILSLERRWRRAAERENTSRASFAWRHFSSLERRWCLAAERDGTTRAGFALRHLLNFERRWRLAAERYGSNRAAIAHRLFDLYHRRGFRPGEALQVGLADPKVSEDALSGCFTKHELKELQNRLNPRESGCLTEDKSHFYTLFESLGVPVPKTYAVVGRSGSRTQDGQALPDAQAWNRQVVNALPGTFITKPSSGVYGDGVRAWTRVAGGFVDHHQRECSAEELYRQLCTDANYDCFIVQERLENHPELVALTGTPTLQTVRLSTLVERSGETSLVCSFWKFVCGDNIIDNFKYGTTGNFFANIALDTGRLGPAIAFSPDGVGLRAISHHPKTGRPFEGFAMPDWSEIKALALRCASSVLPLRTVGWDIALTPRGPVVLEGNRWWDPFNGAVLGPNAPGVVRHEMIAAAERLRRECSVAAPPSP